MNRSILAIAVAAVSFTTVSVVSAAIPSLAPLATFGGGDGWRAPNEIITGDSVAAYPYLGTTSLERGLAYNPVSGNLILVSRSTAGNGIRVLSGTTGADIGFLNQGTGVITGGTFTTSTVGIAADGAVYVANLQVNAGSGAFKVYQWSTEAQAAPAVFFNSTITGFAGTPRLGDSLDVTGSGAGTRVLAGASGSTGYAIITASGGSSVATFAPTGPAAGDFRLGATFAGSEFDVWGKQTGGTAAAAPLRRTTYAPGAGVGSNTLVSGGEMALDYAVIAGIPYLATLDSNSSRVRIYNASNPAALALILDGTTTITPAGNGNGVGSVKFGAINDLNSSATIYAMGANQGIQALSIVVPEPAALGLLAPAALMMARRRRA